MVAAVAGEEVDQEVLAAVAGLAPGRFADAVAEAVAAGILWHRFFEHPTCGFVHTLREAARATVDAEVRRGLHLELATVLEALPARPGRLVDVAHHRRAALLPVTRRSWSIKRPRRRRRPCGCSRMRRRWRSARPA